MLIYSVSEKSSAGVWHVRHAYASSTDKEGEEQTQATPRM